MKRTAANKVLSLRAAKIGSTLERSFETHWRMFDRRPYEREFKFATDREWRFDVAFPAERVAVELEGLVRRGKGGRHQRAEGYRRDCEKYNRATMLGWAVLRFTAADLDEAPVQVVAMIQELLLQRQGGRAA